MKVRQSRQYLSLYALMFFITILLPNTVASVGKYLQYFRTTPHNKNCYTQGIFFLNNTHIFESCGMYNLSYVHVLQYESTSSKFQIKQSYQSPIPFEKNVFLQGSTLFLGKIYILTWREKLVYILNPTTFQLQKIITWPKQGWGLTNNGTHLFVTDGSATIYLCDQNLKIIEEKQIKDSFGTKIASLNQLQYAEGYLWMNVYMTNRILKVSYQEGKVISQYNGDQLTKNQKRINYGDVLNGIAYNQENKQFILTGKYWSNYYQIDIPEY